MVFLFLLVLTRILAMVFAAPVLGSKSLPFFVRGLLAVLIAIAAFPLILENQPPASLDLGVSEFTGALLSEAIIGALIGLGVLIVYSAAEMVGTVIGQMAGIQLDGFGGSESFGSSPAAKIFGVTSAAVFVAIQGPEMLVGGVLDTFASIEIGHSISTASALPLLTILLQQSFVLMLKAVGPAIVALMVSTVVLGMVSKSIPQLNIFNVGLSSNMVVMFLAVFLTLGGCLWLFVNDVQQTTDVIQQQMELTLNDPFANDPVARQR